MILYIIRHGESLGNTGQDTGNDPVLSEKGTIQARLLGERMKKIRLDCIMSSTLRRACTTARETAVFHNLTVETDPMLIEVEDGETPENAYIRATAFINKIKDRFKKEERVAVFAHGTFNNYLINAAIGFPVRDDFNFCQENTGVTCIKFLPDGKRKIEFSNDYCHLSSLGEIEY